MIPPGILTSTVTVVSDRRVDMQITERRLRLIIIEEMALNEALSGAAGTGIPAHVAPVVKSATRAKKVITVCESDVKDHFTGSTGSKYEMSAQGTYISHVPSMQEDEEDKDEDNRSESLKTRERMITIVR